MEVRRGGSDDFDGDEFILLVNKSKMMTEMIQQAVGETLSCPVITARTLDAAEQLLKQRSRNVFAAVVDLENGDSQQDDLVHCIHTYQIPMIVLTTNCDDAARQRILTNPGVVDYFLKSRETVASLIETLTRLRLNPSVKVLVVDDSSVARALVGSLLQTHRFSVLTARNGKEALDVFQCCPDISLVITDFEMPEMNGVDLVRKLRTFRRSSELAILGMSTTQSITTRFLKSGADDFLGKPILHEEFYCRVYHAVRVRQRTLELRRRNDELKGVFNAVQQGLLTIDREGRVVGEVSAAAVSWLGSSIEGTSFEAILSRVDPDFAHAFCASFDQTLARSNLPDSPVAPLPLRLVVGDHTLDFELRPIGEEGCWTRMLVVISDVTQEERRKRLEVELRHAQKLEAVGQLAAGVAHEINTPTQFVSDNLSFLGESVADLLHLLKSYRKAVTSLVGLPGVDALMQEIEQAEEEADVAYIEENAEIAFERAKEGVSRIATLVNAMKEFAHPDRREMDLADLNRALRTTLTVARNEYKYVAEVQEDYGDLPPVLCHLSDINQVFLNLLVNAAHAIADVVQDTGDKGLIRVRSWYEDGSVHVSIQDSGCGIPEQIQLRIFDPFFTTKPVGKGTGQGLAIARSIVVDRHHGMLDLESKVGKGTTFTITLPVDSHD